MCNLKGQNISRFRLLVHHYSHTQKNLTIANPLSFATNPAIVLYIYILYIPGSGRSPGGGHGNPLQYSCLENPMDRGALWGMDTVHSIANSQTRLKQLSIHTNIFLNIIIYCYMYIRMHTYICQKLQLTCFLSI